MVEIFQVPITGKQCEIDMWLRLDSNRKVYRGSPSEPLEDLTFSDLEASKSRSLGLGKSFVSRKGAKLGNMLLSKPNR